MGSAWKESPTAAQHPCCRISSSPRHSIEICLYRYNITGDLRELQGKICQIWNSLKRLDDVINIVNLGQLLSKRAIRSGTVGDCGIAIEFASLGFTAVPEVALAVPHVQRLWRSVWIIPFTSLFILPRRRPRLLKASFLRPSPTLLHIPTVPLPRSTPAVLSP